MSKIRLSITAIVVAVCLLLGQIEPWNVHATTNESTIAISNEPTLTTLDKPTISIANAQGYAGETVDVAVVMENNPGLVGAVLTVEYDSTVMTLIGVTDGRILGTAVHTDIYESPYLLSWMNFTATTDYTNNGVIATLTFKLSEDVEAEQVYNLKLSYNKDNDEILNCDGDVVDFATVDGSITIGNAQTEEPTQSAIDDFAYTVSGNEMTITAYMGDATEVNIGSHYTVDRVEYTVVAIGMEAFLENETITKVTIPETVKIIGEAAFYDCTSLTEVVILSKDAVIEDVALGYFWASRKEQIVDGFTIYGYEGSTAQSYAATSDEITFVVIQEEPEEKPDEEVETISKARLRVFGSNFKVNNGVTQTIYNFVQEFGVGESITLTATGENFAYWMNESNKIVTENKEHTFIIAGDTMLTAVYKNAADGTAYVEFVSDYGQVMQAQNYDSSSEIQMPGAVNKVGYKFISWNMTAEEIVRQISEGVTYIRVTPIYEALPDVFTVTTVYDGDEENAEVVEGYSGYQFKQVTAKAIPGRTFSHWSDSKTGENVLSTSETYSIYINQNTTVYAIYVDEGTAVTKRSTMVTNDISAKLLDETTKSLVVLATRDMIAGYTLVEHGILYSANTAYGLEGAKDTMIVGASGVAKGISTSTATTGTYAHTITLTEEQLDTTVYARGYMILSNSEGKQVTIYGSIVSNSYNGAM